MADDTTSDDDVTDALPEDLNASECVGPYVFPNNNRRRVPGYLYLLLGAGLHRRLGVVGRERRRAGQRRLRWAPGILLAVLGAYHLVAGWDLDVDERDALVAATTAGRLRGRATPRPSSAGAACAAGRRGGSSCTPPRSRRRSAGLVLVDGVDGEIVAHFVEDNPEDWTDLGPS